MKKLTHIVSIIVILKYRNKYLLVQRASSDEIFPGKWQNLGGKVEVGERLEEAIMREVKEEVGITLDKDIKPIFIQNYSWNKSEREIRRLGVVFMIKMERKPGSVKLSPELESYKWVSYNQANSLDTIGKSSETGTLAQLKIAEKFL